MSEDLLRIGQIPVTMLGGGALGISPFDFSLDALNWTGSMAKRAGGVFAGAPILQGKFDGSGVPDVLSLVRGDQIFSNFYANFDPYQGTASKWWVPERDSGAGGMAYIWYVSSDYYLSYNYTTEVYTLAAGGQTMTTGASAVVAGTDYHVVASWDTKKPPDGTNYGRISVNDSITYGMTTQPTVSAPDATGYIGSDGSVNPANAIEEGVRWDRRIWWDGLYGEPYYFTNTGYIDEIAAAYAAGAGADPALVEASWDGCMCLPTDSAVGALVTGNGEAWSHSHSSALLNNTWLEDTFGPNQQDVVSFNGTTTSINCGSAAALDDIASGGDITIGTWVKSTAAAAGSYTIAQKGNSAGNRGWRLTQNSADTITWTVYLGGGNMSAVAASLPRDSKWHYVAVHYEDTTKVGSVSVGGVWSAITDTGAGAYQSEAADDLTIGARTDNAWWWPGDIGHVSIWSDDHHVAGTDFIPPRTKPGAGGALVESWGLDDGTGAAAVATVTPGAQPGGNDGIIANGTWTEKWEFTGTPLELTSLEYDGVDTEMIVTDAAAIRDIFAADATVDVYYSCDDDNSQGHILNKYTIGNGWYISCFNATTVRCHIEHLTNDVVLDIPVTPDGRWHHIRIRYLNASLEGFAYLDGVLVDNDVGVGAYQTDNTIDLGVGVIAAGTVNHFQGRLGRVRFSSVDRGGGNAFLPDTRVNPPAIDGNTLFQLDMDQGAGAQADDTSGNANHGAITDGFWNNSFDQATDSPGSRTYAWGYDIGSDAPSDGVEQHIAVTAGDDWVLRIPVRYEDATAQAQILVYDETGAAAVSTFDGPPLTGLHTGANNSATLVVANEFFPASLIDGVVYNITDGSSGTITLVGGTNQDTITAALDGGGVDDDWDTNDVFMIVPPPNWVWAEPFCAEMPAGCTEASVQLLNAAGDGVLHWQQAEVQTNLVTGDPSIEDNNASNPFITTGWANVLLDAGDTEFEAVIVHSGVGSVEWNVGAIWGEYMELQITLADNKYFSYGLQHRGDGTDALRLITSDAALHYSLADNTHTPDTAAVWLLSNDVRRATSANPTLIINPSDGAPSGDRFHDDVFVIECDDVSLTATPASEANSLEGTGIRIDGRDAATQTQTSSGVPLDVILQATQGWIRWRWTPRHSSAIFGVFGEDTFPYIIRLSGAGTYIYIYYPNVANTLQLFFNDGGGNHLANWNMTGQVVADTTYLMEIKYTPARMELYQDGIVRATITTPIDFGANILNTAWWGSNELNIRQGDAVFAAP